MKGLERKLEQYSSLTVEQESKTMQYFYIKTTDGTVYGSFDSKSEALRYVNYAGFTCDWELIEGDSDRLTDEA